MRKCFLSILGLVFLIYADSRSLLYTNGLSLEFEYFVGNAERKINRTDVSTATNTTWQQYFTDVNWDTPPSTYRFSFEYNKPIVNFLAAKAGVAFTRTDEYAYSRYANYTAESFTENLNSMSLQIGLLIQHRFSNIFNIYLSPSLELVNHFAQYHYEATPPTSSAAKDERQLAYQFRPAFTSNAGFEFIPGGKTFGISFLVLYRNCQIKVDDINIIPNRKFSEEISYPNFGIGLKCSFYLQKKQAD